MRSAEALDPITATAEQSVTDFVRDAPDTGESLTRPDVETKTALGTATSDASASGPRGAAGRCCPCPFPNRPERSQIGNGAVNGTMTSTTSHDAKTWAALKGKVSYPISRKARATCAAVRNSTDPFLLSNDCGRGGSLGDSRGSRQLCSTKLIVKHLCRPWQSAAVVPELITRKLADLEGRPSG
jgi:hypothetical protein